MKSRYQMFAVYNAWCNARLYETTAKVSDTDYRADRGAFFKSLHGTLNHLLVADRIWMQRFTGKGELPKSLDAILFEEFGELRTARRAEDKAISAYIEGLSDADLNGAGRFCFFVNPTTVEQIRVARARPFFQSPDPPPRTSTRAADVNHR